MATITGGTKLEQRLSDLAKLVSRPATLKVGFLAGATAPDGQSIPLRAALNEFGTSRQPPRPFFRNMVAAKSHEWGPAIGALLPANNYDAARVLNIAGSSIAAQLKQSIIDTNSPPLAASTIARKGSSKPLIEHGDMINAVDHEVTT